MSLLEGPKIETRAGEKLIASCMSGQLELVKSVSAYNF